MSVSTGRATATAGLFLVMSLLQSARAQAVQGAEAAPASAPETTYTYEGASVNERQYKAALLYNESIEPMRSGDYGKAISLLRHSLELYPNLCQVHTNLGLLLEKTGRSEEAIVEFKKAIELRPELPQACLDLGTTYQSSGRLQESVDQYKKYLHRFPNASNSAAISALCLQLQSELEAEQSSSSGENLNDSASDYFRYATYQGTTKWALGRFPLKVYIPSEDRLKAVPLYQAEFGPSLKQAFDEWSQRVPSVVRFKFVDSATQADIVCQFTSDFSKVHRLAEGGEAHIFRDTKKGTDKVDITLLTRAVDNNVPVAANLFRISALHEIGHALGILGHSPDPHDVMYCSLPAFDQPKYLTTRDINTIIHLYRPDVSVVYRISSNQDGKDSTEINNEGVSLVMEKDLIKAVEKFEAVLKIDPAYEPARRNLARCLNDLAIEEVQDGKLEQAAEKMKRALELSSNDTDRFNKISLLRKYALVLRKLDRIGEAEQAQAQALKLFGDGSTIGVKDRR